MKRILWMVAVVLSVVFLALSLAGIAGVWVARSYANELVTDVFDGAEKARAGASAQVKEIVAQRQAFQNGLSELSQEIERISGELETTPVVFMALDELLDGKLAPALTKLHQAGRQIHADLAGLDAAVTALNNISIFSQPDALDEVDVFLDRLLADLDKLNSDFRALELVLRERKSETLEAIFGPSFNLIDQLDAEIEDSETRWRDLDATLGELQVVIVETRADLIRQLTWLAIALTATLFWLATSQYFAARYAWVNYHGGPASRAGSSNLAGQLPPEELVIAELEGKPQLADSSSPAQVSTEDTGVIS